MFIDFIGFFVCLSDTRMYLHDWIFYEFWTFLLVKIVLSFFVLIVLFSTFGGCATKVYNKYKYKQLKWSENELDLVRDGDEEGGCGIDDDDNNEDGGGDGEIRARGRACRDRALPRP